jgi:phosphatidylserine decarboxylase
MTGDVPSSGGGAPVPAGPGSTPAHSTHGIPDVTPDLPGRRWRALIALLERLPQAALSRTFGELADIPVPPRLRRALIGGFARLVGADPAEAERPLTDYGSINEFFVRRLRTGARDWPADAGVVASPVDGILGQVGTLRQDRLVQAKGRLYSAAELLDDAAEARRFEGGPFVTLYLSPRHYHRIHTPTEGRVVSARHVPGALLPVNEPGVLHIERLFPRSERLVCQVEGPLGRLAVVAVGAYNVGRISTAFDPRWSSREHGFATNRKGAQPETRTYDPAPFVDRGQELMAFHLGSTVILLMEARARLLPSVVPGREVRLGQPLTGRP